MFFRKNLDKLKVKDVKKAYSDLKKDEFLRLFLNGGVYVDIKYQENFEINKNKFSVGKLTGYTNSIVLHDVLNL